MRILLALLALPVLLLLCILIAYWVPLPASWSGSRNLVAAIVAGLVGVGYLLAVSLYVVGVLRRSTRALDPFLEPLGLVGSGYAGFGRRYTGVLEGRPVEVRYLPAFALQPVRLDLMVEAEPGLRMAVGLQRPLLDCRDCRRVDLGADVPYAVYAQDEGTARRLFADPSFRATVDWLMGAGAAPTLYVQPDRFWFRVLPRDVAGAEVEGWVRELVHLATIRP